MELPNYFFADLPAGAEFSPTMVTEACLALKRNRALYLADRPAGSIIRTLSGTAENWLEEDYPYRRIALERGPAETGFSRATITAGLDHFFAQLTGENLEALLLQELGQVQRLDGFCASHSELQTHRTALATGPELITHITAGKVPNPTLLSLVLGLLVRSAQFVKCARGSSFLPRLFAHSLYDAEPKLGACLEIAEWRGGNTALESVLFKQSGCVTATGSDETLASVRDALPARTQFLGYGHRVSFGFLTREALSGYRTKKIVAAAACDVVAWDQLGCLSPHVFYVEDDASGTASWFAGMLAEELARREAESPRGPVTAEAAAQIASRRGLYEVRAAHLPDATRHWCSPGSTAWTVVYEADTQFQLSCLNRFIYVKAAPDLKRALAGADVVRDHVSTVGVAAAEHELDSIAARLSRWGATRICPLGQMQHPPIMWRHDGRPLLSDLVRWTDWEQ